MKRFMILTLGLTSFFLSGFIIGIGVSDLNEPNVSQVYIPKPTATLTEISLPVATVTDPVAQVVIIENTLEPVHQDVVINPVEPQVIVQDPVAVVVIITDPAPTADLSQYVLPLDAAQQPGLASPYDAGSGPTANIVPEALPVEQYASMSLDQAWDTAVAMGIDQRFPSCSYPLPVPFIDWQMAMELSELQTADRQYTEIKMLASDVAAIAARGGAYFPSSGIVQIPEDTIPPMLLQLYTSGSVTVCRDANNKPSGFGPGVQIFLDQLASSYMVVQ